MLPLALLPQAKDYDRKGSHSAHVDAYPCPAEASAAAFALAKLKCMRNGEGGIVNVANSSA